MRLLTAILTLLFCIGVLPQAEALEREREKAVGARKKTENNKALMERERRAELKKAAGQKAREGGKGGSRKVEVKRWAEGNNRKPGQGESPAGSGEFAVSAPKIEAWGGDFAAGKVFLRLWPDHFFLLSHGGGRHPRDITGLWRQSGDGVSLILYNAQDLQIKISRGKRRLYASFGDLGWGSGELLPLAGGAIPPFRAEGKLLGNVFTDAASGRNFPIGEANAGLAGEEPLFASVEIKNGLVERILAHSQHFPRAYASMARGSLERSGNFFDLAANRHWLLPPMPGAEKASIIFLMEKGTIGKNAEKAGSSANSQGKVEIGGPGIRAEGKFKLNGKNIAIRLDKASLENLELIDASCLADAANGEFEWSAGPGFLNLAGKKGELRLVGK